MALNHSPTLARSARPDHSTTPACSLQRGTKRGGEVISAVEQSALKETLKNGGMYKLKDDKTGKELELAFVDTHQPVRQLDNDGHYFACEDFRVAGTQDQIYDIDF